MAINAAAPVIRKRILLESSTDPNLLSLSSTPITIADPTMMRSEHNNLCMFKVLLVGDSGVGKTSLLLRYVDQVFHDAFLATVGLDFKVKSVRAADGRPIKLQIWDTAGQERYRTMTLSYYRGAMGFIIVFDVTNEASFQDVRYWASQIQQNSTAKSVLLLGNKCDVGDDRRKVTREQALRMADEIGAEYVECSARDDKNVDDAFHRLIDLMLGQIELDCDLSGRQKSGSAGAQENVAGGGGGRFALAGKKGTERNLSITGGDKPYLKAIDELCLGLGEGKSGACNRTGAQQQGDRSSSSCLC